jgi:hypothetical protein
MTWFTSAYKALVHLAPNWDTQLRTDMAFLETQTDQLAWAPALGGTGASLGTGPGFNGFAARVGQMVIYQGRLTFGSSASWGSGTPVITGFNDFGFNTDVTISHGTGRYKKISGGLPIPLILDAVSSSTYAPYVAGATPAAMSSISASPAQSDQLIFQLIGYMV